MMLSCRADRRSLSPWSSSAVPAGPVVAVVVWLGVRVRSSRRSGRGEGSAQTGLCRKRHKRKQRVEARAAPVGGWVVSWRSLREPPADRSGRSWGSSLDGLDDSIATEEQLIAGVEDRVEEERVKLARFSELFQQRQALYDKEASLRREQLRMEQKVRALEQRAERERLRSERFVSSANGSRRGRPVRVEVDPDAWAVVKREAFRRQLWLVWWIGDLVRIELDALAAGEVSGRPSTRRRRSPGEDEPQPRQRFLRIDVDDEHWSAFRAVALEVELGVGRYVGELAEAAAHEAGWRARSSAETNRPHAGNRSLGL